MSAIQSLIGQFEQEALTHRKLYHCMIVCPNPGLGLGGDAIGWANGKSTQDKALRLLHESVRGDTGETCVPQSHNAVYFHDTSRVDSPLKGMMVVRSILASSASDDARTDYEIFKALADTAYRVVNDVTDAGADWWRPLESIGRDGTVEKWHSYPDYICPTAHYWAVGVVRWAVAKDTALVRVDRRPVTRHGGPIFAVRSEGAEPEPFGVMPYYLSVGVGWSLISEPEAGPEVFAFLADALKGAESYTLDTNIFTASAHALRWVAERVKKLPSMPDNRTVNEKVQVALASDCSRNWKSIEVAATIGLTSKGADVTVRQCDAWKNWQTERIKQQRARRGKRGSKAPDGTLEAADATWKSQFDDVDAQIDRGG